MPENSYEQRAEEAEELARRAESEAERKSLQDIAKIWRELAERKKQKSPLTRAVGWCFRPCPSAARLEPPRHSRSPAAPAACLNA